MVEGLFGGPRPLLSLDCLLIVRDYTALPSPTISGGKSPDRTEEFREAARSQLPMDSFSTEPHDVAPDLFGNVLEAELDTDRLQLSQYIAFIQEYARLLEVDDLRVVNVGIDGRTVIESSVPRPFADDGLGVFLLLEIRFPSRYRTGKIERIIHRFEEDLEWIADTTRSGSNTAVLQHHSGPNDLVVTQALELVDELGQYEISLEDITISCSIIGHQ